MVNSPPSAKWTLTLTGNDVAGLYGTSSYGPIVWAGTLPLVLTSTGPTLVDGTVYRAVVVGLEYASGQTPPSVPTPAAMSVTQVTLKGGTIDVGTVSTIKVVESITAGSVTAGVVNQTGTVIETGNHLTRIGTFTFTTSTTVNHQFTLSGLPVFGAVIVYTVVTGTAQPVAVEVSQQTPTATGYAAFSWSAPFVPPPQGIFTRQAIIPLATYATTKLSMLLYTNGQHSKGRCIVHGLTRNPGVPTRSDGRTYPVGCLHAQGASTSTGNLTIVPAPRTPLRVMLRSATLHQASGVSWGHITANLGGTTQTVLGGVGQADETIVWDSGLLCDAGTGIGGRATTAGFHVFTVTYDLVS